MAVLAPSLNRARSELNAEWPRRDHASDGWIGDTAHQRQGSVSDHNPNSRGVVDAIDVDTDGIDVHRVVARMIAHPATNYVIYNRTIWSRAYGFRGRRYTGSDPHIEHLHCSALQSVAAENNSTPWGIHGGTVAAPVSQPAAANEGTWAQRLAAALPVLKRGSEGTSVRRLQALCNVFSAGLTEDGDFGGNTDSAVRHLQGTFGLGVDGVAGKNTWGKLAGPMPTLRRGASGDNVERLQALLNVLNYGLKEDGDFGGNTDAAVRRYQERAGLSDDGIAGPLTMTALLTR